MRPFVQFALADFLIAVGVVACLVDAIRCMLPDFQPTGGVAAIANPPIVTAEVVVGTVAFFILFTRWFRRTTGQDF
jgi:hypothetical protein